MLSIAPRRRFMVRFDPKRIPHMFADVLILGSGIAGVCRFLKTLMSPEGNRGGLRNP